MKRGVYFIANNAVLDLTIAFLNSFRKYNPSISLCLIPYNNEYDKILKFKDRYHFEIFENSSLLKDCDDISKKFHGSINGAYRKLAMWDAIYDEFAYIDIDTIVIKNVDFAFKYLPDFPCYTSHSNMPGIRRFVWKDSIYESSLLNEGQIAFAANTGFITSKKGFMSMAWMQDHMREALRLKPHMELFCQEQPLLNYFIVTSGRPYSSLSKLFEQTEDDTLMFEFWAGLKGAKFKAGELINGEKIFLVHWAGCWQPRNFDFHLYRVMKFLKISGKRAEPKLHFFMPYKKFWRFYRNLN